MDLPFSVPTTNAALFDLLQEKFGIGSYDDVVQDEKPFWKVRMTEISKIKAMMRKRRGLTLEDVAIAVWYCERTAIPITNSWQVINQVPEALRAWRAAQRASSSADAATEVADVLLAAQEAGEHDFAARLVRADAAGQRALIEEWRSR